MPGFEVVTELADIPPELRGLHRSNPVNLPPRHGVQIELPPSARGTTPSSTGGEVATLAVALASGIRNWAEMGASGREGSG